MSDKFALFDGNNLAHIAFHRGKSIILKNKQVEAAAAAKKKGKKFDKKSIALTEKDFDAVTGMMYTVFFRKMHKLIKIFKDYHYIFTWDNPGSSEWRRAIMPGYKASRDYDTDPIWRVLFDSIDELRIILDSYPIFQMRINKLEADDIMYVMAGELAKVGEVVIVSGDSDMIQAIQRFGVKVYHPIKDKYVKGPNTYDYCLYKAIKGDKADEIIGIHGYGEKKATKLAEDMWGEDFVDDISCPELDDEQQRQVLMNLRLIRIENNPNLSKVQFNVDDIYAAETVDFNKIQKFYFDHKLRSLVEGFDSVISIFS